MNIILWILRSTFYLFIKVKQIRNYTWKKMYNIINYVYEWEECILYYVHGVHYGINKKVIDNDFEH